MARASKFFYFTALLTPCHLCAHLPSPSFCEYPQEIGLQFTDGAVAISQVQFLSHQAKIATRVELFVGNGPDYFSCQFSRLGYLSLDSNERSAYKVRALPRERLLRDVPAPEACGGRSLRGLTPP